MKEKCPLCKQFVKVHPSEVKADVYHMACMMKDMEEMRKRVSPRKECE